MSNVSSLEEDQKNSAERSPGGAEANWSSTLQKPGRSLGVSARGAPPAMTKATPAAAVSKRLIFNSPKNPNIIIGRRAAQDSPADDCVGTL
jgi:hypothetical protein